MADNDSKRNSGSGLETIFGIHSVQAVLKSSPDRVRALFLMRGRQDQRVQKISQAAKNAGVQAQILDRKQFDRMCDGNHQGVLAHLAPGKSYDEGALYELLETVDTDPLILVLDGVTDTHNLGACLRTADAAGAHAVVIPKDNSASLNETARKVACGAAEHVPLIPVTNLARTLRKLQELGLWVAGTCGDGAEDIYQSDLSGPRVIVMGSEGDGMRRLTKETCDMLVRIPMMGTVSSLNVSAATAVVLFEVHRQRNY
ncbi:MAG: 23S rRNA (guanosine(2251)-2'-O)-methyltransferase RlmB [Alteromonadaceae bacterium]|nr:MAG: 23S rRNA (guanosine(2251)-2'-O)-methyltransferase RlmB [Alteromonadaceae bacterium]